MDKEKVTEELVRQNGNQAAAVMADYAGQGGSGGSSLPKFSDFAVLEKLTEEEREAWEAVNVAELGEDCFKINKKVLEKLSYIDSDGKGTWEIGHVAGIDEIDETGNILAIRLDELYLAKNSSKWLDVNVPDSASDDYFYRIQLVSPK